MRIRLLKIGAILVPCTALLIYWEAHREKAASATSIERQENHAAVKDSATAKEILSDLAEEEDGSSNISRQITEHPEMIMISGQLGSESLDGEVDLSILSDVVQRFEHILGGLPSGGWNEAIVGELLGSNEKRIAFLDKNHPQISPSGALLDRYGTPYSFHPISDSLIQIRSAGPDRIFYSDDDHVRD